MLSHFTYLRILNLLLGIALATTSFYLSYRHEQDQIFQRYTSEVDALASSLELELGRNIALLMSFRSFHEAFPQVDERGFSIFSRNARQFNGGVYGMKWAPRVLDEDRESFEKNALQKLGVAHITDINDVGEAEIAPPSDEYYPILISEPAARQELPIGYDVASKIETRTALETAASNNQAIGTKPIAVKEGGKRSYIYFISLPIYKQNDASEEDRLDQVKGFVVGLYDIEAIFNNVLDSAWSWDTTNSIALDDNSGQSSTQTRVAAKPGKDIVDGTRFEYTKQLSPIADLQWFLVGKPSKQYFHKHRTAFPYMLGVGILLFSLMIEAYLGVLRRVDKELQDAALIDGLTRVANRRRFFEQLNKEWPRAQRFFRPITIVVVDVDNFKKYNDIYGHVRGDRCLHDVAQALNKGVQRPGDIMARYGGEEFAIILPETTLEAAREVADKCRQAVQDLAIEHTGNAGYGVVTVSMGVACVVPEEGLSYGDLIEMADQALYESKEKGRNRVSTYRTGSEYRKAPPSHE
ncbi:MAG TPA: diguanylate cyclase [Pseudomonadales bacterium]|nr:diguanylate cyclase [Pseudomonadales bacterium]